MPGILSAVDIYSPYVMTALGYRVLMRFMLPGVDVFVFGVCWKRRFVLDLSKVMKLQNEK